MQHTPRRVLQPSPLYARAPHQERQSRSTPGARPSCRAPQSWVRPDREIPFEKVMPSAYLRSMPARASRGSPPTLTDDEPRASRGVVHTTIAISQIDLEVVDGGRLRLTASRPFPAVAARLRRRPVGMLGIRRFGAPFGDDFDGAPLLFLHHVVNRSPPRWDRGPIAHHVSASQPHSSGRSRSPASGPIPPRKKWNQSHEDLGSRFRAK